MVLQGQAIVVVQRGVAGSGPKAGEYQGAGAAEHQHVLSGGVYRRRPVSTGEQPLGAGGQIGQPDDVYSLDYQQTFLGEPLLT